MKVLHILPTLERRGAQVFARDLAVGLARRGEIEQAMVVLYAGPDDVGMRDALNQIEILTKLGGVRKVISLRKHLHIERPDILFAHGGEPLKYAVLARGFDSWPKIVYRKIGLSEQWLGRYRWIKLHFQRWLLGRADAISTVGVAMKQECIELFHADLRKIEVIYRGVQSSYFDPQKSRREQVRHALGIATETKVLIAVGALAWEKNLAVLLRTMTALLRTAPDSLLLLIGDGPERCRLEKMADDLGITDAVRFLGKRNDVPDLMAGADLMLLTSLTEGVPGVLIEAGMAGLPCVTWDVAGAREVVQDGITGLVTPYLDEGTFTAAVVQLLGDQTRSAEMGTAAHRFCCMRFDVGCCVAEHARLFQSIS